VVGEGVVRSPIRRRYSDSLETSLVGNYEAYQSECSDQPEQDRHWVSAHWWRQAGQTPPVSNVFHS
jgi:hypothetical protein